VIESKGGDDAVLAPNDPSASWCEGESRQTILGAVELGLASGQLNEVAAFLDAARQRPGAAQDAFLKSGAKAERDSAASFSTLTIRARGLAPSEVIPNANKGEAASGVGRPGF